MSPIIISTVQDDLTYWQEINIDNWRFQKNRQYKKSNSLLDF